MPQHVITNFGKQLKTISKQEADDINVANGYAFEFYDGSDLMLKNDQGEYIKYNAQSFMLMLKRPPVDDPVFLKLYTSQSGSTSDMTIAIDTNTSQGRLKCKVCSYAINGVVSWKDVPSNGISVEYSDSLISVDLSEVQNLPGYIFWRWETAEGSDREYDSMFFPSSSELQG